MSYILNYCLCGLALQTVLSPSPMPRVGENTYFSFLYFIFLCPQDDLVFFREQYTVKVPLQ